MEYDPQTASDCDLTKKLESFDKEFDAIAASIDIIAVSTEKLLETLDRRLSALVETLDQDSQTCTLKDA